MPIYAYKCASCGHAKDVLQKISDAPLTVCPACGEPAFSKQVTAAGFQLKGSGWYVTDFRSGSGKTAEKPADKSGDKSTDKAADTSAGTPGEKSVESAKTESKPADASKSTKSGGDAPSASAGGCGSSCACH